MIAGFDWFSYVLGVATGALLLILADELLERHFARKHRRAHDAQVAKGAKDALDKHRGTSC